MELRTEVAEQSRSSRVFEDHPTTTGLSPSMFKSALGRGLRMHIDSLTESRKERQTGEKHQMLCPMNTPLSTSINCGEQNRHGQPRHDPAAGSVPIMVQFEGNQGARRVFACPDTTSK